MKVNKKGIPKDGKLTLHKAIKNVKNILQTENVKARIRSKPVKVQDETPIKRVRAKLSQRELSRGIVYIGHIPHGFYEEQMEDFFKQFGRVTRVRLVRSKQSGRSCGYGYVEFQDPEVAKIAANSMNNYLMCDRVVKTTYIPPEKQHIGFFTKHRWTKEHYPRLLNRSREVKNRNDMETSDRHKIIVKKSMKRLSKISRKLEKQGIDFKLEIQPEEK